eukprot:ANDGO_03832.mRNA.1 SCF E3 ubiquitin ligase complex F-box protein grrA
MAQRTRDWLFVDQVLFRVLDFVDFRSLMSCMCTCAKVHHLCRYYASRCPGFALLDPRGRYSGHVKQLTSIIGDWRRDSGVPITQLSISNQTFFPKSALVYLLTTPLGPAQLPLCATLRSLSIEGSIVVEAYPGIASCVQLRHFTLRSCTFVDDAILSSILEAFSRHGIFLESMHVEKCKMLRERSLAFIRRYVDSYPRSIRIANEIEKQRLAVAPHYREQSGFLIRRSDTRSSMSSTASTPLVALQRDDFADSDSECFGLAAEDEEVVLTSLSLDHMMLSDASFLRYFGAESSTVFAVSLQRLSLRHQTRILDTTLISLLVENSSFSCALRCLDISGCTRLSDDALSLILQSCHYLSRLECSRCSNLTGSFLGHAHHLSWLDISNCENLAVSNVVRFVADGPLSTFRSFQSLSCDLGMSAASAATASRARFTPNVEDLHRFVAAGSRKESLLLIWKPIFFLPCSVSYVRQNLLAILANPDVVTRLRDEDISELAFIVDASSVTISRLSLRGSLLLTGRSLLELLLCPPLRFVSDLDLSECSYIPSDVLCHIVALCGPSLVSLVLVNMHQLDPQQFVENTVSYLNVHRLQHVDLTGCGQVNDFLVCHLAVQAPLLEALCLERCIRVTQYAVECIAQHCPNLRHLNLNYCGRLGTSSLAALASKCLALESLHMARTNALGDSISDATLLSLILRNPVSKLRLLDLTNCVSITADGLSEFVQACTGLTWIRLCGCRISPSSIAELQDANAMVKFVIDEPQGTNRSGTAPVCLRSIMKCWTTCFLQAEA